MSSENLEAFKQSLKQELFGNILPYWVRLKRGDSFISALDQRNEPIPATPLGLIMVSRLLWTYSRAFHLYRDPNYRELAEHARRTLLERFQDLEHGGFYWTLDESGSPLQSNKQCYGQAFCIYAFSEHYIATGDASSLEVARALFDLVEAKAWEPNSGGYLETFTADWTPLERMRLGEGDLDAPKTMNNHLHLIEGYSNLLRAKHDDAVKASCERMLRVILDRIILPDTPRFGLFYDMEWNLIDPVVSPGHDIEGSWLLWEAAEILGEEQIAKEIKPLSLAMAELVLKTGLDADGGVFDEFHLDNPRSDTKCWWPQAEGVVGFFNAYQLSGDERYLQASRNVWKFIQEAIVDRENGEWRWGVHADGTPMNMEKAGPWKSAYHNGRACFEMLARLEQNTATATSSGPLSP